MDYLYDKTDTSTVKRKRSDQKQGLQQDGIQQDGIQLVDMKNKRAKKQISQNPKKEQHHQGVVNLTKTNKGKCD